MLLKRSRVRGAGCLFFQGWGEDGECKREREREREREVIFPANIPCQSGKCPQSEKNMDPLPRLTNKHLHSSRFT